jgi:hypothetical protein
MSLINVDNSHDSAGFSSSVNPRSVNPYALPEPLNNIMAAKSQIFCNLKGGKRKNISNMYKRMRRTHKRRNSKKTRHYRKTHNRRRRVHNRKRRTMRGGMPNYPAGYAQYQNNLPMTQTYETGGKLIASESALANPPPVKVLSNCTNCVDNYSRYTNSGFPSRGWW